MLESPAGSLVLLLQALSTGPDTHTHTHTHMQRRKMDGQMERGRKERD